MPDIDKQNFLTYLSQHHPYLYDIEKEIERITMNTGYGDISFTFKVINGEVESGENLNEKLGEYSIKSSAKTLYKYRKGNKI